ncbi:MAG: 50S ribosomal protein L15 [Bacteroidales bacterium]|nr:50S ribosomal protein L15 [Bacteroidales bacterium]MDZ4204440.1 50S ribosomal protein L15 [Bacteroidales bacterium]
MDLSNLKPATGSVKNKRRIGRGEGSGSGDTAGRGHKGAQSRSGYSRKKGFEGGQMPLHRRLPKFGFKNRNRIEYSGINIDVLQKLAEEKNILLFTPEVLCENGLIGKNDLVKILGRGQLTLKIDVTANAFSASAVKAIESTGGTATKI